jgi:hypothetical protein
MKGRHYLLLPLLIATAVAGDVQKIEGHLTVTRALIKSKKYPEALQRLRWFYDHCLEYDIALHAVRDSYALGYWKDLGDVYPPARQALLDLREEKSKLIRTGKGTPETVSDVARIDTMLSLQRPYEENQ